MAPRRRSRFVRPPERTKIWIGAGVGSVVLVASTKQLLGTLSAGALLLRPFTILRTRMELRISSDQSSATERCFGDFGRIVVTDTASGIGVTAVPNPGSQTGDPDADWFVHQSMSVDSINGTNVGFDGAAGANYIVDSKAMRKVGPNDDIVSMFMTEAAFGGNIITHGRMLIQLH